MVELTTSAGSVRSRRAVSGAVVMLLGSSARYLTGLAIVPLVVGHLSEVHLGVLLAVLGLTALLEPFDLGIGSALMTVLGRLSEAEDDEAETAAVRWSVRALARFVVLAVVACGVWFALGDPAGVIGVGGRDTSASVAFVLGCGLFFVGLPLELVNRANLGLQDGRRVGVVTFSGQMISLTAVVAASLLGVGLVGLVVALAIGPIVARALAWVDLLRRRPHLRRPAPLDRVDSSTAARIRSELVPMARLFFILQFVVAVGFTADQYIVANVLGAETVPEYAVPARLFAFLSAAAAILLRPMWPALAAAAASGDRAWVDRVLWRIIGLTFGATAILSVVLIFVGPPVVSLLGRDAIVVDRSLFLPFAIWTTMASTGSAVAMALNALAVMRTQIVLSLLMAVANLILSIVLVHRWGVSGVLWGSIISYTVCVAVPLMFLLRPTVHRALDASSPHPVPRSMIVMEGGIHAGGA